MRHSVLLEELSWRDVQDALSAGVRTIVIVAGSIEPHVRVDPAPDADRHGVCLRAVGPRRAVLLQPPPRFVEGVEIAAVRGERT
jgi:hypothetical protein